MIPAPPKATLGEPGMTLEGIIIAAQPTTNAYGREVLDIRVQTPAGPVVEYRCNKRLWQLIHDAAGTADQPRLRITRTADGPAIGNGNPTRNFTVEPLHTIPAPQPQPHGSPPAAPAVQVPAW